MTALYQVQTRKEGRKYETRWTFLNEAQAYFYYNAVNIAAPYTKRLLVNGQVVHKVVGS
jgi:hypothetical protein